MSTTTQTTSSVNDLLRRVRKSYSTADAMSLAHLQYVFGGNHGNTDFRARSAWERGVDCSSGASVIVAAGGMLAKPPAPIAFVTQTFETWGEPGEGRWLTVWVLDTVSMAALPEHAELAGKLEAMGETHHVALDFHGDNHFFNRFWQATHTGGPVGWVGFDPRGFNARHFSGA